MRSMELYRILSRQQESNNKDRRSEDQQRRDSHSHRPCIHIAYGLHIATPCPAPWKPASCQSDGPPQPAFRHIRKACDNDKQEREPHAYTLSRHYYPLFLPNGNYSRVAFECFKLGKKQFYPQRHVSLYTVSNDGPSLHPRIIIKMWPRDLPGIN